MIGGNLWTQDPLFRDPLSVHRFLMVCLISRFQTRRGWDAKQELGNVSSQNQFGFAESFCSFEIFQKLNSKTVLKCLKEYLFWHRTYQFLYQMSNCNYFLCWNSIIHAIPGSNPISQNWTGNIQTFDILPNNKGNKLKTMHSQATYEKVCWVTSILSDIAMKFLKND